MSASAVVPTRRIDRREVLKAAASAAGAALSAALPRGLPARAQEAASEGTLRVAIAQPIRQLDPALAWVDGYGDVLPVAGNVTEGLTRFRDGSADVEPGLAEEWTVSVDGLTYVFVLRSGVTFHDGTPLDAKAAETSLLRQFDPSHPLHQAMMSDFAPIVFTGVKSIAATSDMELTIVMEQPTLILPASLAVFAAGIVSPSALKKLGTEFGRAPVGTGPFRFDRWEDDGALVLAANEDYWGGRPQLDRIVWRTVPESADRVAALRDGSIDVADAVDFTETETIEADSTLQLLSGSFRNVQYLGFNVAAAPFDKIEVRQAIQHAIDKDALGAEIFASRYVPGAGPLGPELVGYDAPLMIQYPHDPARARQLLQQAGAADLMFACVHRAGSFWPRLADFLRKQLAEAGITMTLRSVADTEFAAAIDGGEAQAFLDDWTSVSGDPDDVMTALFSLPLAIKRTGYVSDDLQSQIEQGWATTDPDDRWGAYGNAQQIVLDDAAMVVLGYPERGIAALRTVDGITVSPVGLLPLGSVGFKAP